MTQIRTYTHKIFKLFYDFIMIRKRKGKKKDGKGKEGKEKENLDT